MLKKLNEAQKVWITALPFILVLLALNIYTWRIVADKLFLSQKYLCNEGQRIETLRGGNKLIGFKLLNEDCKRGDPRVTLDVN